MKLILNPNQLGREPKGYEQYEHRKEKQRQHGEVLAKRLDAERWPSAAARDQLPS